MTADPAGGRVGFGGRRYARGCCRACATTTRSPTTSASWSRGCARARELLAPHGTLYFHIDYREAHYCKLLLDEIFGRDAFLNELIWAYDYGAKPRRRWPAKHDTILVYVRTPGAHHFDADAVEREPYMAPGLVSAEKAARGKRPTDVWFHTIVPTNGAREDRLPDPEARGGAAPDRRRLLASRRLVPGPVRGLGHARRGLPPARPPLRPDRLQPGRDRGHARPARRRTLTPAARAHERHEPDRLQRSETTAEPSAHAYTQMLLRRPTGATSRPPGASWPRARPGAAARWRRPC